MQNIYHITISHPRYDGRVFKRLCQPLAEAGLSINLIVSDGDGNEIKNKVKIYDIGYKKNKLINFLFFQIKIFFIFAKNKSILHIHEPILLPIGTLIKFLGNKVIFDMHENLDIQLKLKSWIKPNLMKNLVSFSYRNFENIFLSSIDGVTVPQPIMVKMYKSQNKKIISVANYYMNSAQLNKKIIVKDKNYNNLIYAGSVSNPRGYLNMINLMRFLPSKYYLHIAGNITKAQKELIPKKLKNRIIIHGYLNQQELSKLYLEAGIGLIMFNNIGQYFMSYSLKLFEYINYGMLVIMPNFGEWNKFNKLYKVGLNVDTSNSKLCAKKIIELNHNELKQISINNLSISNQFNWKDEIKKLINFYSEI